MSSYEDRPAPDAEKLLSLWMEWERGEQTPGRVMANLNTRRNVPGLGDRLRELRKSRSQNNLATQAGTTPGIIVQAERHNLASTETLNKLARALGVSVDALLGRAP